MIKPSGGRGKRAPYKSIVVRVPEPCLEPVLFAITTYWNTGKIPVTGLQVNLSRSEAVEVASKILNQKKSARVSLQKLLTAIYGDND